MQNNGDSLTDIINNDKEMKDLLTISEITNNEYEKMFFSEKKENINKLEQEIENIDKKQNKISESTFEDNFLEKEAGFDNNNDIEEVKDINNIFNNTNDVLKTLNNSLKTDDLLNFENLEKDNKNIKSIPKTGKESDKDKLKIKVEYAKKTKDNEHLWGFNGIAGMEDLKEELKKDFINPLKLKFFIEDIEKQNKKVKNKDTEVNKVYLDLYKQYKKLSVGIPTGFLMYGPPGTGKTFLVKKLAEELNAGFISQSMGDLGSSYMHQTTQNIKILFDKAKEVSKKGPTILFLDEIDSLVTKRTDRVDAGKAEEVSQFLQEFNKLAKEAPNLIVIAATNRPDHLDSALLRSGRFDKKIYLGVPDDKTRTAIFKLFIEKSKRPHGKLNYKELVEKTKDYVIADIENIVKESARVVGNNILKMIEDIKLTYEKDKTIKKFDKKNKNDKISQSMLLNAISKIPSSIAMVDMSIYEEWNKKMNIN